jgi:hypothetical protein
MNDKKIDKEIIDQINADKQKQLATNQIIKK